MNGGKPSHKDENGYWRFSDSNILVHRYNAFKFQKDIFINRCWTEEDEETKKWHVHHIDLNQNNNESYNLLICSEEQHKLVHNQINAMKIVVKSMADFI